MNDLDISILLFRDAGVWIAKCLEYEFVTQGDSPQLALGALEKEILGQIHLDKEDGLVPLQEHVKEPV